ncbi:MAG: FxsA family protein [Pseudomonadota bacterium]
MPLFIILVAVPIVEIGLFIEVGGWIGLWPTLAIVVATALAGAALLRSQGRGVMADLQGRLQAGGDPTGPIAHGAMILFAGALLLTPGFFTDAVGFALLVPPVRAALLRWGAARFAGNIHVSTFGAGGPGRADGPRGPHGRGAAGDVVDGEYEAEPEPAPPGERVEGPAAETPPRPGGGSGWTRP